MCIDGYWLKFSFNVLGNILFRKFHMCSVPVKLKLFFNSYCSSLYTRHLWWNYKKMSVTKPQIAYHNILKRNIGLSKYESTSATCTFTNTQCCQSNIRNIVYKFVCGLNKSDNALIKALLASSVSLYCINSAYYNSSTFVPYEQWNHKR